MLILGIRKNFEILKINARTWTIFYGRNSIILGSFEMFFFINPQKLRIFFPKSKYKISFLPKHIQPAIVHPPPLQLNKTPLKNYSYIHTSTCVQNYYKNSYSFCSYTISPYRDLCLSTVAIFYYGIYNTCLMDLVYKYS
jgi:hypothetical protein